MTNVITAHPVDATAEDVQLLMLSTFQNTPDAGFGGTEEGFYLDLNTKKGQRVRIWESAFGPFAKAIAQANGLTLKELEGYNSKILGEQAVRAAQEGLFGSPVRDGR